jgi:hypothetical protein
MEVNMALKPTCSKCGRELEEFGAILLGPPDSKGRCKKDHLCRRCHTEVKRMIRKVTPT